MRKNFFAAICFGIFLSGLIFFCPKVEAKELAADTWIYTNSAGTKYYLRDYGAAARSWCYAVVLKVDAAGNAVSLVYRLESGYDGYSVYYGTKSFDVVARDARPTGEKGKISQDTVASIIWNRYVGPMDAERWKRIRENENGRR